MRDNLRTRATLDWNPSKQNGMLPALDGGTYPQGNFDIIDRRPNYTAALSADWVANAKVYVGARAGYFASNHTTANVTEQPLFLFPRSNIGLLDVPASLQHVGGFQTDLSNDVSRVDRLSRINAQVDSTFFGNLAGEHTLKAGVQLDRRGNDVDKGQSANRVSLFWNAALAGQRGLYGYYRVTSNPIDPKRGQTTSGNVSDTIVGLFVQDSWTVNRRLTVNLGLCTENETVPFYSTVEESGINPIHFSFGDKLAPRLGAAWDVTGDGRWKVHGSWGVFYDIFKLAMPQLAFGGLHFSVYSFNLDTYDWPNLLNSPGCPPACPGGETRARIRFEPSFENLDPDLDPMRMQEVTLGVEHQLSPHLAVSARFIHKQLDKAVEDIGSVDADGNATYVIGNPGFLRATEAIPGVPFPKAVRDYDAVEFVGRKLLDDNWALTASYVWSRLYGNYSGLSESDENGRTEPNIGATFDSAVGLYDGEGRALYGRLATDRPHQAKAQFIYTAPFGLDVGVFQSLASGLPVSRSAVLTPGVVAFYAGRGSDGRTPAVSQTDLNVQYSIRLGGRKGQQLTLGLNVLNVFNQAQGVSRFSFETDPGVQVVVNEADYYAGRADVGAAIDQQHAARDPRFLQYRVLSGATQGSSERSFQFLAQELHGPREIAVGDRDNSSGFLRLRSCRRVRVANIDAGSRKFLDGLRQGAGPVRHLEEQHLLLGEEIARLRQCADRHLAVQHQQSDAPLLPAGLGRGDGEEIHTPVRQVAAEPRERADFIVEWKIQLSGCRHSRSIAASNF